MGKTLWEQAHSLSRGSSWPHITLWVAVHLHITSTGEVLGISWHSFPHCHLLHRSKCTENGLCYMGRATAWLVSNWPKNKISSKINRIGESRFVQKEPLLLSQVSGIRIVISLLNHDFYFWFWGLFKRPELVLFCRLTGSECHLANWN